MAEIAHHVASTADASMSDTADASMSGTADAIFEEEPLGGMRRWLRHRSVQYVIAPVLLAVAIVLLLALNGYDLFEVLSNLVKTGIVFCLLALGASLVISASHIDLSSIGVASMGGMIFVGVLNMMPPHKWYTIPTALLLAVAFSAISGLLVAYCFLRLKAPLLIFTWALGSTYVIMAIILTGVIPRADVSGVGFPWAIASNMWALGRWGFFASAASVIVAIVAIGGINLPERAAALGASETSAEFAGVSRSRTLTECFVINAILACCAGIFHAFYLNQASTRDLSGSELTPIAIAVLGGTALTGGYLSSWSVVAASLFWSATRLLGPLLPSLFPSLNAVHAELGPILFT